jgi:RNA polymerase sigma factor (sigma-70 family)
MAFPETRQTLIERLATGSDEADWRQFLTDYWGPVCRFAAVRASLTPTDAEDVASLTFEAILTNRLLARWMLNQSSKLRTLLCTVVRNIISNRARVNQGRERILRELAETGPPAGILRDSAAAEQFDVFYAAWAGDILQQAAQSVLEESHRAGKGDYFRVLYSRICEQMTMPEIAEALSLPLTSVENYFKAARKQLSAKLEQLLRDHVARYCSEAQFEREFNEEWQRLGEFFIAHGGLEDVLRQAAGARVIQSDHQRKSTLISSTLSRVEAGRRASLK